MRQNLYDSIHDKLVRHGYVYIEAEQYPVVIDLISDDNRFKQHINEKGISVIGSSNDLVKLTINDWKPYSSNVIGESV